MGTDGSIIVERAKGVHLIGVRTVPSNVYIVAHLEPLKENLDHDQSPLVW